METSITLADIDQLIQKEENRYGSVLGRVLGKGISDTESITALLVIATRHETLMELRNKYLIPAETEVSQSEVQVNSETTPADEPGNIIPPGLCNSESCEDELCVAYWAKVENGG